MLNRDRTCPRQPRPISLVAARLARLGQVEAPGAPGHLGRLVQRLRQCGPESGPAARPLLAITAGGVERRWESSTSRASSDRLRNTPSSSLPKRKHRRHAERRGVRRVRLGDPVGIDGGSSLSTRRNTSTLAVAPPVRADRRFAGAGFASSMRASTTQLVSSGAMSWCANLATYSPEAPPAPRWRVRMNWRTSSSWRGTRCRRIRSNRSGITMSTATCAFDVICWTVLRSVSVCPVAAPVAARSPPCRRCPRRRPSCRPGCSASPSADPAPRSLAAASTSRDPMTHIPARQEP